MRIAALVWIATAVSGAALSPSVGGPSPGDGEGGAPPAFHPDPMVMERSVLDATRALLREDPLEARRALDRMADGCRRIGPDDEVLLPSDVIAWNQAFSTRLNLARELAARENVEGAFDSLVAIQRACRGCHEKAAEHGGMAPPRRRAD